jgi:hypothetical protein
MRSMVEGRPPQAPRPAEPPLHPQPAAGGPPPRCPGRNGPILPWKEFQVNSAPRCSGQAGSLTDLKLWQRVALTEGCRPLKSGTPLHQLRWSPSPSGGGMN